MKVESWIGIGKNHIGMLSIEVNVKGRDMLEKGQDTLTRAYSMLSPLRKNIDKMTTLVPEAYVNEFHSVLTKLEGIGINVSEFRTPDSEVKPQESTTASMCVEGKKIWGGG